jgi:hypothetical protein
MGTKTQPAVAAPKHEMTASKHLSKYMPTRSPRFNPQPSKADEKAAILEFKS